MLLIYPAKEERYFCHFKGGKYKYIHSAFDSETQERIVVYQALYGAKAYWVRPEKMFFEKIIRDGKKILVLAGKAQPKVIREDKLNELLSKKI